MSQNIFSLKGLISWLETQPPNLAYKYSNNRDCLITQYFRARGVPLGPMGVGSINWEDADRLQHDLPDHFDDVAIWGAPTYGGALKRAKIALSESRVSHL